LRNEFTAREYDQAGQKGDEKANTGTHCLQFSAIAAAIVDCESLHKRFPLVTSAPQPDPYDIREFHQKCRARLVPLATKVAVLFPKFRSREYNGGRVISV
jgi:hypothetical protein